MAEIIFVSDNKASEQFKLCCKFENRDLNHFYLTCFDRYCCIDGCKKY